MNAVFACTCWRGSKIFHQYSKFRKRSSGNLTDELDENQTWESWTWWKSEDDESREVEDLMKIRREVENLMKISHTIITWVQISHASADRDQIFLVSMTNFKSGHLTVVCKSLCVFRFSAPHFFWAAFWPRQSSKSDFLLLLIATLKWSLYR